MNASAVVKPVGAKDVEWVASHMKLRDLDGQRRDFLMSLQSLDASACPGSGKTTLVAAKLAILAKNWESRTRGVCVLSHTNVAREQIQGKLAATDVGDQLLRYPHFIDTIHGFVNRFLAVPWLLSRGYRLTMIDDEATTRQRRRRLGTDFYGVNSYLERKNLDFGKLRLTSTDFTTPLLNWTANIGATTPTHRNLSRAMQEVAEMGYFCFDEMFLFARALIKENPEVAAILRSRFPFVLIDEMQDTSAEQLDVLETLFPSDSPETIVQRVGDVNQAIFEEGEEVGQFPDDARQRVEICDSFRFDDSVASLIANFAVRPVEPDGLRGIAKADDGIPRDRHTVFVFPDGDTSSVLPEYASLVLEVLKSAPTEDRKIAAVGFVHQAKPEISAGDRKYPSTVSHYWDKYSPSASQRAYQPSQLIEYLRMARALVVAMDSSVLGAAVTDISSTTSGAINFVATGVARLANICSSSPVIRLRARPHRNLEQQLAHDPEARHVYREVVTRFVLDGEELSKTTWETLRPQLHLVTLSLSPAADLDLANDFLRWIEPRDQPATVHEVPPPNALLVEDEDNAVWIDLSSIHAVKGETHAATLVLDTFFHTHFFKSLMPWLVGDRVDATGCGQRQEIRLRAAYVAMSRPALLLCLALPRSSLGEGDDYTSNLSKLRTRGWSVVELG